jgi:hypothetical protein
MRQREFVAELEALGLSSEARINWISVQFYSNSARSRIKLSSCCEVTQFSIIKCSVSKFLLKRVLNDNFDSFCFRLDLQLTVNPLTPNDL